MLDQVVGSSLLGWIEGVVHVDGGDDVPGAPHAPGEDDEVAGAELDAALWRALHGGAHLASHDVARLPRSVAQRVPPRRAAPPTIQRVPTTAGEVTRFVAQERARHLLTLAKT